MTEAARDYTMDLAARVLVGALFTLLCANLLADFVHTHRITGLFLLTSEALVLVLTLIRRRAQRVHRSHIAAVVVATSMAGPWLVRAAQHAAVLSDVVTAAVSAAGLILVVAGKLSLGRSFGIAPANRGVVVRGPYSFMRHPIYTGYLITHVAFVLEHATPWNIAVLAIADSALVVRALVEERVLSGDSQYRAYCGRVPWHLVPGVF
ncbi:MAG: methyltransferase family protein [Betaproteobacteria bacterium]